LEQYNTIEKELQSYGESVSNLERWLVCTKSDLLLPEEAEERVQQLVTDLAWDGPLYTVSSSTREGLKQLCLDVITQMNQHEETAEE
jgi:GTP-binding protein